MNTAHIIIVKFNRTKTLFMKKIVLLLLMAAVAFACNNSSAPAKDMVKSDSTVRLASAYPEVSMDSVVLMMEHYKTLRHNIDSNIVQVMTLRTDILRTAMTNGDLKLITGAYLQGPNKNQVTVFMQVNNATKPGTYNYYDVRSMFGAKGSSPVICPPPGDCGIPLE
jgi:hypothetical protein